MTDLAEAGGTSEAMEPATLAALLGARAADAEQVAMAVDTDGTLTYGSWDRRSSAQAHGLVRAGVRPGDRVALLFDAARWIDYAVTYLAVHKAAAVAVPLRPDLPGIELRRILRDCHASVVVAPDLVPGQSSPQIIRPGELEHGSTERFPLHSIRASTVAEILYTSRPLAPPVPTPRSHRALLAAPSFVFEPGPGSPSLVHAFPVGSVAGQHALCASLRATPVPSVVFSTFDPDGFCALLSAGPGRACALHPSTAQALLDSDAPARHDVSQVTGLVLACGRVPPALLLRLCAAFPRAALLLVDVLGRPPGLGTVFHHHRSHPRSLGRPAEGSAVWVTDDAGRRVVAGGVGKVWARVLGEEGGRRVSAGGAEGGVPTGDLGYLDEEGFLYIVGGGHDVLRCRWAPRSRVEVEKEQLEVPTIAAASCVGSGAGDAPSAPAAVAFSQEGMLWQECFAPGSQNLPGLARRFRGPLDVGVLGRALDEIVRRHAALRTTFALRDGRPVQVLRPHRPLDVHVRDLSGLGPTEWEAEVERLVSEAGRRPFDLVAGPLFEPTLLRLGDDEHVLVIRTHHAVFDDWSVGVFRRELSALYSTYAKGGPSPLPELPVQFADFSRRQRRTLAGAAGARQLEFWRRELAGAPLTTQLPVDDPDLPEGSPQQAGEPVSLTLPAGLRDALRALARRERTTLYMTMLAAFGVLAHRYTGQEDILLATVVANRNRTELEGVIGCFTKKVPLRLDLSGDPTFADALGRVRHALLGALSNQDLPFEAVVQDVLGAPASSHGLVPHVVLMFQGVTPRQELTLPGLETAAFETSSSTRRAHFMAAADDRCAREVPALPWGSGLYLGTFVILSLIESQEELSCVARGAFHGPAVSELMKSYRAVLSGIVADPRRRVSELAILDRRGTAEVLERGRGVPKRPPADTLPAAFAAQVQRAPEAIAVQAGAEVLSYAELAAGADRLADRLRALGVGRGARVGIALEPSREVVLAALAVWKAGAAWVGLDPADTEDRLTWIVRDASIEIAVGDPRRAGLASHVPVVAADAEGGCGLGTGGTPVTARPDDAAIVFYGSGPSAVARGVVLDHRSILNLLTGLRLAVHDQPGALAGRRRVWLSAPPTHDGFLRQLVGLLAGHSLHVPGRGVRADPHQAVSQLGAGKVDLLDCTPDELEALLRAGLAEALGKRERGAVDPVLVVGTRAAVGPELWRTLRGLPRLRAYVLYGLPETAFGATVAATGAASSPRGVGRSMANVGTHVLDPRGRPVPTRAVGELNLGGASLARGYLGHPAATRARFLERPLGSAGLRLYRTGQLARSLPDGGVELLGSSGGDGDLRGFRIEAPRIRSAVMDCPGVREATVELRRDEHGERRLVAFVVPDGQPPTLARIRRHLWSRLPGYAWPSSLLVVPRLPAEGDADVAGTVDRRRSEGAEPQSQSSLEASVLGTLWAGVLGVERVMPEQSYWHAFSFLEALARARDAGVPVAAEHVIRNRTLETLTAAVDATRGVIA